MIWQVADDGLIDVVLETTRGQLVKPIQQMVHDYTRQITADMEQAGLTLLRDEYRIRQHTTSDRIQIFWKAQVPEEQVEAARSYLATLAESHAGS